MKDYIAAERTGNWHLHLATVRKMVCLFAATAHINYAKSARLHLQNMMELQDNYPWLYEQFSQYGFHTVRRSDKFWGGLWSDLIIEQVLMRSLKSRGGITRGRGISESVRITWINTMHRCASVHDAASSFTNLLLSTSEQHIDLSNSRIKRDNQDLEKLISWFDAHEPFDRHEPSLKSLATGITASSDDNITCDNAENVGLNIQKDLDGKCIESVVVKRSKQVKTLEDLSEGVKVNGKKVNIDPAILFTRLTALTQSDENIQDHFAFELTHEPTALFKDGLLRKPQKAKLRNYLLEKQSSITEWKMEACVLDGGALLHKIKWKTKTTYREICLQYIAFVRRMYGKYHKVCIVFDGYCSESTSIKAQDHQRRQDGVCADVQVTLDADVTTSNERFLRNSNNKQRFIQLLY